MREGTQLTSACCTRGEGQPAAIDPSSTDAAALLLGMQVRHNSCACCTSTLACRSSGTSRRLPRPDRLAALAGVAGIAAQLRSFNVRMQGRLVECLDGQKSAGPTGGTL